MKDKKSYTEKTTYLNITEKTITTEETANIKIYTQDDFDTFLEDYQNNTLPDIYITEFLFDGVGMYKTYDLDDYIEDGNDVEVKTLKTTVFNINTTGNIEITGEITEGMLAVNTNDIKENINIILNNVKIDTDSKKIPAIYVYNKDIAYTDSKVTISAKKDTKNYIEGGKFKKVSLIAKEDLDEYANKYKNEAKTWYEEYTNYYGVYTKEEIEQILFAKIEASSEDLQDGDPYYFYKGAGVISSDIDLYFEGEGYLEVTSKGKEGIESKGNLTFSGGIGDYVIKASDDCLNTTTKSSVKNARNDISIDVNSLTAIVSLDADEGDAIDSNGTLTINGGTIIAIAHPGQDAGLDSEKGTYINGGTVIATGDMYDQISSESKQRFIALSFNGSVEEDTVITLLSENEEIFSYQTDRKYTYLIYSSNKLKDETYSLYEGGTIKGIDNNGFYTNIDSYEKGTQLGYATTGQSGKGFPNDRQEMPNGMPEPPNGEKPENMPEPPSGEKTDNMPEPPSGEMPNDMQEPPSGEMPNDINFPGNQNNMNNSKASNKDFVISGISNIFSGVAKYSEE